MTRPHPWTVAAFIVTLAGAVTLGEVFPFSRYSMYADLAPRSRGFLPVFLADGVEAEPSSFTAFSGLSPEQFRPPTGIVSSLDYVLLARAAWVENHPAEAGRSGAGAVRVEVGYDLLWVENARLLRERHIAAEGLAWR